MVYDIVNHIGVIKQERGEDLVESSRVGSGKGLWYDEGKINVGGKKEVPHEK